jgi:hypothetical protein
MRRGITLGELLVALAVLLLFVAITLPIYNRVRSGTLEDIDTDRMRKVYVALSLYEFSNDGQSSPTLLGAQPFLADNTLYLSDKDPWVDQNAKSFPLDPELPKSGEHSDIRISFSYLPDFVRAGKLKSSSLQSAMLDPRVGLITSGWHGTVTPTGAEFEARLFGPVLRVNTNGSLYRLGDRGGDGKMGDPQALFYKR